MASKMNRKTNTFFEKHKLKFFLVVFSFVTISIVASPKQVTAVTCIENCATSWPTNSVEYEQCKSGCNGDIVSKTLTDATNTEGQGSVLASWGEKYILIPILQVVLRFTGFLLSVAETIFEWIVDANNLKAIMNNNAVYTTWVTVRDLFNVAFIMVLLFSAFATIFQASSNFNYKNVLLNLVIMALLVNFSYPIARFIIDASNILMYGLLQGLGGDSSFVTLIDQSGLSYFYSVTNPSALFLMAAIIFTFILAITLLVIGVLLVIRTIALTIYIIFSPVAFVGKIAPGTKLASSANEWWTDFMKYCFSGPIIIFYLYVATKLFGAISSSDVANSFHVIAVAQTGVDTKSADFTNIISKGAFFSLPIVILWLGIIQAQKSGIAGAGAVVGYGKKAGKWLAKNPALGVGGYTLKKTGVSGAVKQRWDQYKKNSILGSEKTAQRETAMAARFGVKGALEKDMKRRADEYKKSNTTEAELKDLASKGDAAAAYRLAEDKQMDQATYAKFTEENKRRKGGEQLQKSINSKVKQNRADIVANYEAQQKVNSAKPADITAARNEAAKTNPAAAGWSDARVKKYMRMKGVKQSMGDLSAEKFSDQNWVEIAKDPPTAEKLLALKGAAEHLKALNANDPYLAEIKKRMSPTQRAALRDAAQKRFKITLNI